MNKFNGQRILSDGSWSMLPNVALQTGAIAKLTKSDGRVYMAMVLKAHWRDGGKVILPQETLASYTGIKERAVRLSLQHLIELNLIRRLSHGGGRRGNAAVYQIVATTDNENRHVHARMKPARTCRNTPENRHVATAIEPAHTCQNTHDNRHVATALEPARNCRTKEMIQTDKNKRDIDAPLVLPLLLDTSEFRKAWGEWEAYRKEMRKPLTESTIKRQIGKLEKLGHDTAIETIERSIEHGWTGLFELDRSRQHNQKGVPKLTEKITVPEYSASG
ncbi:MAG: hypothetical protein ABIG44_00330 [Planctomycetota bacterium]